MMKYITKNLEKLESSDDSMLVLVDIITKLINNFEEGKISSEELIIITRACLEGVRNK